MVYEPIGTEDDVLTVKVVEKVGFPELGLKLHDAPEGAPEQDRLTDCVGPPTKAVQTVVEPELPRIIVIPPKFEIEKSNAAN
jgi:hypothetical protein